MATYTLTINENTKIGKSILNLLLAHNFELKKVSKKQTYSEELLDVVAQGRKDIKNNRTKKIDIKDLWK